MNARLCVALLAMLASGSLGCGSDNGSSEVADQPITAPASVGTQSFMAVAKLGATSLAVAPRTDAPSGAPDPQLDGVVVRAEAAARRRPARAETSTLVPPSVEGRRVVGKGEGFSGFSGISHHDQFLANEQLGQVEPPDQGLCVGHGFVLEVVNDALRAFSTSGEPRSVVVDLNGFFHLPPALQTNPMRFGPNLFDPRCTFDNATQRWFLTVEEVAMDPATGAFLAPSHVLLAVSGSHDPTRDWFLYGIATTDDGSEGTRPHDGCPCFGDQPLLGVDANGVFITANEQGIGALSGDPNAVFNGAQLYAMSKAALVAGGMPSVVHIDNLTLAEGLANALEPAASSSPASMAGGTQYFLSNLDFDFTLDDRIGVWALTNTRSLATPRPNVSLTQAVLDSEVYGAPPPAGQQDGPTPLRDCLAKDCLGKGASTEPLEQLATGDDRMNQVVYARGQLWGSLNSVVSVGGETRAGIAYFVVKPTWRGNRFAPELEEQGYLAVTGGDLAYSSVAVSAGGQAVVAFSLLGPDRYPSLGYAVLRPAEDGYVHTAAAGLGAEDGYTGYTPWGGGGVARWGDYTTAVADGAQIWMGGELIPIACASLDCGGRRTPLANWGTFLGHWSP